MRESSNDSAAARSSAVSVSSGAGTTMRHARQTGQRCTRLVPSRTALNDTYGSQMVLNRWFLLHRTVRRDPMATSSDGLPATVVPP